MPKKRHLDNGQIELPLNSFVRRTEKTDSLKALVTSCGGLLTRKGRSRNWRLVIALDDRKGLVDRIYQANEASWLWLAKQLSEVKVAYEPDELLQLVRENPSITINELMTLTDCSIGEARKTLDQIEWDD